MGTTNKPDFRRTLPESWQCIDCERNTAPGIKNRAQNRPLIRIGSRSYQQLPKVFWWPERIMVGFGELETSI
jgi:hypothetical protein